MNYAQVAELAFKSLWGNNISLVNSSAAPNPPLNEYLLGLYLKGKQLTSTTFESLAKIPKSTTFSISSDVMDLQYNYDFTNVMDHTKFYRGGKEYIRPCGWQRIGLSSIGKYTNNKWLTDDSGKGTWINTYYPTNLNEVKEFIEKNESDAVIRKLFKDEAKIVSTLDPKQAEKFSNEITIGGNKYKFLIQCRVDSKAVTEICGQKFFVCTREKIRPYGLLVKPLTQPVHVSTFIQKAQVPLRKRLYKRKPKETCSKIKMQGITLARYSYKVLKTVQPELGIGRKAINVMDSMLCDLMERIAFEANRLSRYRKSRTLTIKDLEAAVKLLLPKDLSKHAVTEAQKSCIRYGNN